MSRANESAFPTPHFTNPNGDIQWGCPGMTLREHFAGLAMQGLCACFGTMGERDIPSTAVRATQMADALLAALAKEQP